jgi:pyrroline-5-carboxylate reductase
VTTLNIGFIGGGNMAASIIGGLLASGSAPESIWASDPSEDSLAKLRQLGPINTVSDNDAVIAAVDVIVLAVKPQILHKVSVAMAASAQQHKPLVVSIAAGVTSDSINQWLGGELAIVRCMPNTPALLRCGATALFANPATSPQQRQQAEQILSAVGLSEWVEEEAQLDAVTAVSGSGPAYFFLLIEAMQASAEKMGLSAEQARKLTQQTALGAARMALESDVDAAELRRRVTSPNGTTERAIGIFEQGGLRELVDQALQGAKLRSEELAKELDAASD